MHINITKTIVEQIQLIATNDGSAPTIGMQVDAALYLAAHASDEPNAPSIQKLEIWIAEDHYMWRDTARGFQGNEYMRRHAEACNPSGTGKRTKARAYDETRPVVD